MLKDDQNEFKKTSPSTGAAQTSSSTPHKLGWLWITLTLLVIGFAALWWYREHEAAAKKAAAARGANAPVPVVAGNVVQKNVPVYLDGLGTVQAFNTVTVRPRIDGQLKKVAFTEGQEVHAGDLLAEIDPDPFQAALEQAQAKKVQDEALLGNAQNDMKRETELFKAKVDSQQAFDTQQSLVNQYAAAVKADAAAVDSAQVQLNYARIVSPIDGRTGIRQVDQGNIVHATDTNGVVVVTQLRPITVVFTLPEQMLGKIHKQMASQSELKVLAIERDNSKQLDEGKLAVIDNEIDSTTGTIKIKATFPNEKMLLWPGQFVNVRLLLNVRTNGLVVPASVIQRGPQGTYVFLVQKGAGKPPAGASGKDGKKGGGKSPAGTDAAAAAPATPAAAPAGKTGGKGGKPADGQQGEVLSVKIQPVKVAQIEDGEALVESGLTAGQRVVVDGQYKLQDGSSVKVAPEGQVQSPKDSIQ